MEQKGNKLDQIKELYDQLKFSEEIANIKEDERVAVYNKNQELSENILSLIEDILKEDELNKDALFWKIKLYNGPYFDDVSVMLSVAEEIIDKCKSDKKSVLSAYDWLAWIYDNKLELKEKAIEILHDKLIEVSLIEDDYSLKDREFGETYYLLAFIYKALENLDTASSFYQLAVEHYPDHYYATYQGGNLFLEREQYDLAYSFLQSYYKFHGNEYSVSFAKRIEELFQEGKIEGRTDLLHLMYSIGLEYFSEFGYKSTKEFGMKYLPVIDSFLEERPDDTFVLRMKAQHYTIVEKNTRKAFDLLDKYFKKVNAIVGPLYYIYFELGDKLSIDVQKYNYPLKVDGFYGYNLMTRFLEAAGELKENNQDEQSLRYYKIAQDIGMAIYPIVELYFKTGQGNKVNNNPHGFAMICNNLGIAIRNVAFLGQEENYDKDIYREAIALHKRGYDYFPFWENLDSGMRIAELVKDYDSVEYFGLELLTYYDNYSVGWMSVQGKLLKNSINADDYEKAEQRYLTIKEEFEKQDIEDEDIVAEMIYLAADFFTYVRFKKEDYHSAIAFTEDFFSNAKYFELRQDIANINYWFSLAWCYHSLKDREQALQYFQLMIDNYGANETYTSSIEDIPAVYKLSKEEQEAVASLHKFIARDSKEIKNFPILDKSVNHVYYLEKLMEEILKGKDLDIIEDWISDNIYLRVYPRHLRKEVDEIIYDTYFDLYLHDENITIRFNLDEREEKVNGFLGLFNKKVWSKEVFVYFYHYNNEDSVASHYKVFGEEDKTLETIAQQIWNEWLSKL
ncbi:hypothetical protein [Myroides injenensis]|uniref:hypothetical protein n=1 Tax=Myroides injenensis TaxID=1183151 RepID=UPI002271170F|nr:hypothetical protein [Myroides injenensis]